MTPRFSRRRIPTEVMDKLRIAAAVASEQVLEEHVRSAVEMVEVGGDRAPIERLIVAYARLHHIDDQERHKLRERVLATLGRGRNAAGVLAGPRSLVGRIRRRLRGRVNRELRDWVEQHTARVELTVLEIHVDNTLRTLRVVDGELPVGQAVSVYSAMLDLRPTVAEMVRLKVLKSLHDRDTGQVRPLRPDQSEAFPLRVENNS